MCLTPEFFKKRLISQNKYQALGYIDLDEIPELLAVSTEEMWNAGLFVNKEAMSTAELQDFIPSTKGSRFFRLFKANQLIMLKPKMVRELLLEVRAT